MQKIEPGISCLPTSALIHTRLAQRKILRRFIALVYIAAMLVYLVWRFTIINESSLTLSLTYYLAEWMGFILALTLIFSGWNYHYRSPAPPEDNLTVDVLIPVYREPLAVIRRTLIAAKNIEYPHQTFVLDDGQRHEVKELADELNIAYLSRSDNIGAKAGNLNFGLQHSGADFVAVFDADHIAQPHALHVMLGFFKEKNVAMVQSPQDYYNTDAFQYMNPKKRPGLWHDQSWFYNIAQSSKDTYNAASCVGTGVIYRRAALDVIGGIPSDTVTEDIHTSLKLHKKEFKAIFLGESIAYGIAAADLDEYYKTRLRWAHGNLATLKTENIFTCKGLTFKQRLAYLSLGLIYLEGWQQLLLFMVPIIALTAGWAPFEITPINVSVVLIFPILTTLLLQEYGAGLSRYWTNEIFAMARWPIHIMASLALVGKKLSWRTSAKNIQGRVNWRLMSPQIILLSLNLIALAIAFGKLQGNYAVGPLGQFVITMMSLELTTAVTQLDWNASMTEGYSIDLVAVAGFWALFNTLRAICFVWKAIVNARNSHPFFRFSLPFPVSFPDHPGEHAVTEQIAEDWIRLKSMSQDGRLGAHPELKINISLPAGDIMATIVVTRQGHDWLEGRFNWPDDTAVDPLAAALYSLGWQREFYNHQAFFPTPLDYLLSPYHYLIKHSSWQSPTREWHPVYLWTPDTTKHNSITHSFALIASDTHHHSQGVLITFRVLQPGQHYRIEIADGSHHLSSNLLIIKPLPISSLPHKGLDGCRYFRYSVSFL